MTVVFWVALVLLGIPTLIFASFPFHAVIARRRSRAYRTDMRSRAITVIVPVKGLDEARGPALRRLLTQRVDGPLNWVFCVEEPKDPALPELHALASAIDDVRVLITGPCGDRLGKLHNLIEGVRATDSEWLVFVDSDTILPHSRYLQQFTAPLHESAVGLVTCFPAYRRATGIPAFLLAGGINHDLLGYFSLETVWGGLKLANGSCMAMRREVLEGIGGLAPQSRSLLMDVILARRVHSAGRRVVMHHEPVEVPCRTVSRTVWWNQAHRWQVGMAHVLSGAFYTWYVWMRTVFPLGLILIVMGGPIGIVGATAVITRLAVMLVMGQLFLGDRAQLRFLWLLPGLEVIAAIGGWYALIEGRVEWRGRRYRVSHGGVTRRLA